LTPSTDARIHDWSYATLGNYRFQVAASILHT
jgi:hypothetical protein